MDARGKNMIDTEIVNKFKKAKEALYQMTLSETKTRGINTGRHNINSIRYIDVTV